MKCTNGKTVATVRSSVGIYIHFYLYLNECQMSIFRKWTNERNARNVVSDWWMMKDVLHDVTQLHTAPGIIFTHLLCVCVCNVRRWHTIQCYNVTGRFMRAPFTPRISLRPIIIIVSCAMINGRQLFFLAQNRFDWISGVASTRAFEFTSWHRCHSTWIMYWEWPRSESETIHHYVCWKP